MMRSEEKNQEFIVESYENALKEIARITDLEELRQFARHLADTRRDAEEFLAEYKYGHLKPHDRS